MRNCIVTIIYNVFEKNDEGGLFPLKGKNQRVITSDRPPSVWFVCLFIGG